MAGCTLAISWLREGFLLLLFIVSISSADVLQNTSAISGKLMALLKNRGFHINPKLDAKTVPVFGRSLVANAEIYDGEYLVESRVTYDITQVSRAILDHTGVREWTNDPAVKKVCDVYCQRGVLMSLGLIYEVRKEYFQEGSSFWGVYATEVYPQKEEEFSNIVVFDSEMLNDLLVTTGAQNVESFENFLRTSKMLLKKFDDAQEGHRNVFTELDGKPAPSIDDMLVSYGTVLCRTFDLSHHPPTIVAGIDALVNHNVDINVCPWFESPDSYDGFQAEAYPPPTIPVDALPQRQRFAFQAGNTYMPGRHVYHFYNHVGSMQLLAGYGFIRPPSAPVIVDIGKVQFPAAIWAARFQQQLGGEVPATIWDKLCSKDAMEARFFSDEHEAAWPEDTLLCLRASSYKSGLAAKDALLNGWLVQWDNNPSLIWTPNNPAHADWVKNDLAAYNTAMQHCQGKLDKLRPVADKWETRMIMHNGSLDSSRSSVTKRKVQTHVAQPEYMTLARGLPEDQEYVAPISLRRQFATAIIQEKAILERCLNALTSRITDLEKINGCCVTNEKRAIHSEKGEL